MAATSSTVYQTNIPQYAQPYVQNMMNATQAQIFQTDASGNVTGGNIVTAGQVSATGNLTAGNVSATNIAGNKGKHLLTDWTRFKGA